MTGQWSSIVLAGGLAVSAGLVVTLGRENQALRDRNLQLMLFNNTPRRGLFVPAFRAAPLDAEKGGGQPNGR